MGRKKLYETEEERVAARRERQRRYNKTLRERTVCIQARVSPALARKVDAAVAASGLTRADWLRELIEESVER